MLPYGIYKILEKKKTKEYVDKGGNIEVHIMKIKQGKMELIYYKR